MISSCEERVDSLSPVSSRSRGPPGEVFDPPYGPSRWKIGPTPPQASRTKRLSAATGFRAAGRWPPGAGRRSLRRIRVLRTAAGLEWKAAFPGLRPRSWRGADPCRVKVSLARRGRIPLAARSWSPRDSSRVRAPAARAGAGCVADAAWQPFQAGAGGWRLRRLVASSPGLAPYATAADRGSSGGHPDFSPSEAGRVADRGVASARNTFEQTGTGIAPSPSSCGDTR